MVPIAEGGVGAVVSVGVVAPGAVPFHGPASGWHLAGWAGRAAGASASPAEMGSEAKPTAGSPGRLAAIEMPCRDGRSRAGPGLSISVLPADLIRGTSTVSAKAPAARFSSVTSPPHARASSRAIGRPEAGAARARAARRCRGGSARTPPPPRPARGRGPRRAPRCGRRRRRSTTVSRPASSAIAFSTSASSDAVEVRRGAPGAAGGRRRRRPARSRARRRRGASARAARSTRPRRGRRAPGQLALAGAAEDEQLVDHLREPVDLAHAPRRARRAPRDRRRPRREPPPAAAAARSAACAAGARRRRRSPAGPQQALDPLGHLVEGPRERALLGAALDRARVASRSPAATAARGLIEAADRPGDLRGDQRPGRQPEGEHHARQRGQVEDRASSPRGARRRRSG